mgnify:CR=1 FL=1
MGWGHQKITSLFADCDFKKSQKLQQADVETQYKLSALLSNCLACLRPSQTSQKLRVLPPSLEEYLTVDEYPLAGKDWGEFDTESETEGVGSDADSSDGDSDSDDGHGGGKRVNDDDGDLSVTEGVGPVPPRLRHRYGCLIEDTTSIVWSSLMAHLTTITMPDARRSTTHCISSTFSCW